MAIQRTTGVYVVRMLDRVAYKAFIPNPLPPDITASHDLSPSSESLLP